MSMNSLSIEFLKINSLTSVEFDCMGTNIMEYSSLDLKFSAEASTFSLPSFRVLAATLSTITRSVSADRHSNLMMPFPWFTWWPKVAPGASEMA